jgi:hypothetical protein
MLGPLLRHKALAQKRGINAFHESIHCIFLIDFVVYVSVEPIVNVEIWLESCRCEDVLVVARSTHTFQRLHLESLN